MRQKIFTGKNKQKWGCWNLNSHQIGNVTHISSFYQHGPRLLLLESGNPQIKNYFQTNA